MGILIEEEIDASAPQAEETELIDTLDGVASEIPSEDAAKKRATTAHVALGEESPGPDRLYDDIIRGNEKNLRETTAWQRELKFRQEKLNTIEKLSQSGSGPLTPEEQQEIMNLSTEQFENNPDVIFETEYGRKLMLAQAAAGYMDGYKVDKQDYAEPVVPMASQAIARNEVAARIYEDVKKKWDSESFLGKAGDILMNSIPGWNWYQTYNLAVKPPVPGFLPGKNKAAQFKELYSMAPDEMQMVLKRVTDGMIAKGDVGLAMEFMQEVISFSQTDEALSNLMGILDLTTPLDVLGAVKGGLRAAKGARAAKGMRIELDTREARAAAQKAPEAVQAQADAARAAADIVQAVNRFGPDPQKLASAAGDVTTASRTLAARVLESLFQKKATTAERASLSDSIPAFFNPEKVLGKQSTLEAVQAQRLVTHLTANSQRLLGTLVDVSNIERLSPEALEVAMKNAERELRLEFHRTNDAILDVRSIAAENNVANVYKIEATLGKPDGTLFNTRREAWLYGRDMYGLKETDYTIGQQGNRYNLKLERVIDETHPDVRAAMTIGTNKAPTGLVNTFMGWLRTPEDTLSKFQRDQRHTLVHASNVLHKELQAVGESLGRMSKSERSGLQNVLENNRDHVNPATGERGMFYETVADLEQAYRKINQRLPTEKEVQAYFDYVWLNDYDWMVRNMGLYRDKVRQGIMNWHYPMPLKGIDGTTITKMKIEGKRLDALPEAGGEDAGIWLHLPGTEPQYYNLNRMTPDEKTAVDRAIWEGGHEIIQIANPTDNPLKHFAAGGRTVNFVVAPAMKRSNLLFKQIDYKPGGHVIYKNPWYVKQPRIVRTGSSHDYEGDATLMNFATEAEAKKYASVLDEARRIYLTKDDTALKAYIDKNLPMSMKEFKQMFSPRRASRADGSEYEIPPLLNAMDPIRHTYTGANVMDVHKGLDSGYSNFRNTIRSQYNLYQNIDKKFAGQRNQDLMTVREGTEENPLMNLQAAEKVSPYDMMDQAIAGVIRSRLTSDYKFQAVDSWIAEFGHLLDVPMDLLKADPVYYLHTAQLSSKTPMSAELKQAALNSRRALKNLLGTETTEQSLSATYQQKLMSSIYEAAGQKASNYVADHLLPVEVDPFKYMRSFAFHTKLGMFNPVQIWLQAQTLAVTAAISPKHAVQSLAGSVLQRMALFNKNPQISKAMADVAVGMGWKREDFLDSLEQLKLTGYHIVEGEVAWKDAVDYKMFKNSVGKALDKGTMFFKGTERIVRLNAWNTAYREWRELNPGRAMTNRDRQGVLVRADDLAVNMTRASNAGWQQGMLSVPTQFWGYQARIMELMTGKRLTVAEKARVVGVTSLLYGVPIGTTATTVGPLAAVATGTITAATGGDGSDVFWNTIGGAAGGAYPWAEDLRKAALENGVDTNSTGWTLFLDGLPKLLLQSITGSDTNYAERYGPSGLKIIKELMGEGDKTVTEMILGASGSIVGTAIESLYPTLRYMSTAFEGGNEELPLVAEDFLDIATNVSTVNNTVKMINALNIGKYITKNQIAMSDMTTMDAILAGVMGLSPQEVSDAMLMSQSLRNRSEAKKEAEKGMIANFRKALTAAGNQDRMLADMYMKRAKIDGIAGGLDPLDHGRVLREAIKQNSTLVDKIRADFYLKNSAPDKREILRERFIQDQNKERGQ